MEEKKVVLITGCSSGFGYHTALKFARNGWLTFAGIRDLESAGSKELLEVKKKENLSLEILSLDVTSPLSVEEGAKLVVAMAGRIDVLVNNAGFGYFGPVEEFSIDEVRNQYETNVFGVLRMVKSVAPVMRQQKSGLIINVSSIAGLLSLPLNGVYSSSKFALESLTEALRLELSHFNIKVSLVEPGSFSTRFWDNLKHPKSLELSDSPYRDFSKGALGKWRKAENKFKSRIRARFFNPDVVVNKIYDIAKMENPSLRYPVGMEARVVFIRKLLPQNVWERLVHKIYNW
jgi:short-subunit dehydrogenase